MSSNEKINYWLEVLSDHEDSGQSLKSYCESHRLSYQTALYWRRKICTENKELEFIEISTESERSTPSASGITLITENGLKIELSSSFDVKCLRRVAEVLEIA